MGSLQRLGYRYCCSCTPFQEKPGLDRMSRTILHCGDTFVKVQNSSQSYVGDKIKGSNMWYHYKYHISHLGDSWRVGMWQVRWKTLGHLSQQRSSPPFWQTAHQSSLGSSSGSAVFSVSGCPGDSDCCTFRALVLDRGGVASGGWDFAWAPVLLSGRLEPTVTFTSKRKINPLFYSCYTQSV